MVTLLAVFTASNRAWRIGLADASAVAAPDRDIEARVTIPADQSALTNR